MMLFKLLQLIIYNILYTQYNKRKWRTFFKKIKNKLLTIKQN